MRMMVIEECQAAQRYDATPANLATFAALIDPILGISLVVGIVLIPFTTRTWRLLMKTNDKSKTSARPVDLSVKPVGKKGQPFVTPGMMFNKA